MTAKVPHALLLLVLSSAPLGAHALTPGERALSSAPRLLLGGEPEEGFGSVLASPGDITGDGLGDLLVGAPAAREGAGRVYLFSGADMLSRAVLRASDAWAVLQGETGWAFGSELEVLGDVDGDGFIDWGVGAPLAPGEDAPPGRFWVFGGRTTVSDEPLGDLSLDSALVALDGPSESAFLGEGFAGLGDLNGDGLADFGLLHRDADTSVDTGELHVVLGRSRGNWPPSGDLGSVSSWSYTVDSLGLGGLGFTMENTLAPAGDLNGDGIGDIYFGMPGFSGDSARTGAVALLPGLTSGEVADAAAVRLDLVVASPALLGEPDVIDAHFGQPLRSLGAGEVLWAGADGPDQGRFFSITPNGTTLSAAGTQLLGPTGVQGAGDVVRSDLSGTGEPTFVFSAPRLGEAPGTLGAGVVAVFPAGVSGVVEFDEADATFFGDEEDGAGVALAAANIDADAYDDVFVGAPGAYGAGAVFLLSGEELADGDGVSPSEGDCNDAAPTVAPGKLEIGDCADNLDNDCNGLIDEADEPCALEGSGYVVACSASGSQGAPWALALMGVVLVAMRRRVGARRRGRSGVGVLALLLLAGCTTAPLPEDVAPAIRIVSPVDDERITETSLLAVEVEVDGVRLAAESAGDEPTTPGDDAPKTAPDALWALSVDGLYRSTGGGPIQVAEGLTPGVHIVRAELRDTADQPLDPEVSTEISVEIVAGNPSLTLLSPVEDAVLPPAGFEVRYDVSGFVLNTASIGAINQLGVGHAVIRVDDITVATDGDGRAFITGIAAGEHTLAVVLVNNDQTMLDPPVLQTVNVVVAEPQIVPIAPLQGGVLTGPDITIEYEVDNFTLDPINTNGAPESGSGHTHVYLDGLYRGLDASGSFLIPAVNGCAHTLRLELAEAGHAEIGVNSLIDFDLEPCVGVEGLSDGQQVTGPQVTIPFTTPGFTLDGTLPSDSGKYVTQYLDGTYVGFTTQPGNAVFTGVLSGEHEFELRLAEGPASLGSEPEGELDPKASTAITLQVQ